MADGEIRRGVSEGLRRGVRSSLQSQKLFHFLQSRTPTSVVGLSDAGGDLLRESEMRLRRDKAANAVGRPSWRSSFLGDAGAKFLCGKLERGTKKEKSSKKERKGGLWKLTSPQCNPSKDWYARARRSLCLFALGSRALISMIRPLPLGSSNRPTFSGKDAHKVHESG